MKDLNGVQTSKLKCPRCQYVSETETPFLDVCLSFPTKNVKRNSSGFNLSELIAAWGKDETLGKGEGWKCDKCKNRVQAVKSLSIGRITKPKPITDRPDGLPKTLVFTLKRFDYTPPASPMRNSHLHPKGRKMAKSKFGAYA